MRRYLPGSGKRKFDGKIYHRIYPDYTTSYPKPLSKRDAERLAYGEKASGRKVRIVKIAHGYAIYVRGKG